MAVSDLTGTSWKFHEDPIGTEGYKKFSVNFWWNNTLYTELQIGVNNTRYPVLIRCTGPSVAATICQQITGEAPVWYGPRIITFVDGSDIKNKTLIKWMSALGAPATGHTVTYYDYPGGPVTTRTNVVTFTTTTLPRATRTSAYDFCAWYYDSKLTQQARVGDAVESNISLYGKWVTHVSTLTGTRWKMHDYIPVPSAFKYFNMTGSISGVSDSGSTYTVTTGSTDEYQKFLWRMSGYTACTCFTQYTRTATIYFGSLKKWLYSSSSYDTTELSNVILEITGGTDVTNTEFIYWLEENADRVPDKYLCIVGNEQSTITSQTFLFSRPECTQNPPQLYYSWDKTSWSPWTWDSTSLTIDSGQTLYMKGNDGYVSGAEFSYKVGTETNYLTPYCRFLITGSVALDGSLMGLIMGDSTGPQTRIPNTGTGFAYLFVDQPITSLPELPATSLVSGCYAYTFSGTNILTTVPLPATYIPYDAYEGMFSDCKLLKIAESISAEDVASDGMRGMFSGCSSLVTVPTMTLSATSYKSETQSRHYGYNFYHMFSGCTSCVSLQNVTYNTIDYWGAAYLCKGCTSLLYPPNFMTTIMPKNCFQGAFAGCTRLTRIPDFSKITSVYVPSASYSQDLHSFSYTFENCSNLTSVTTLPRWSASSYYVDAVYQHTFDGCTNLSYIEVPFNTWITVESSGWAKNWPEFGTMVLQSPDLPFPTDADLAPTTWDIRAKPSCRYNLNRYLRDHAAGGVYAITAKAIGDDIYAPSAFSNEVTWGSYYPISVDISNGTFSGDTRVYPSSTSTVYLAADRGYKLPDTVVVDGASLRSYNPGTGAVIIQNPGQNVKITAACVEVPVCTFDISGDGTYPYFGGGVFTVAGVSYPIKSQYTRVMSAEVGEGASANYTYELWNSDGETVNIYKDGVLVYTYSGVWFETASYDFTITTNMRCTSIYSNRTMNVYLVTNVIPVFNIRNLVTYTAWPYNNNYAVINGTKMYIGGYDISDKYIFTARTFGVIHYGTRYVWTVYDYEGQVVATIQGKAQGAITDITQYITDGCSVKLDYQWSS